jgi:site-specific DNA recombinase
VYRSSTRTSRRKLYYYRCLGSDDYRYPNGRVCTNRPIRQDYLDELVWRHVIQLFENPDLIHKEIKRRIQEARNSSPTRIRKETLAKETLMCKMELIACSMPVKRGYCSCQSYVCACKS